MELHILMAVFLCDQQDVFIIDIHTRFQLKTSQCCLTNEAVSDSCISPEMSGLTSAEVDEQTDNIAG